MAFQPPKTKRDRIVTSPNTESFKVPDPPAEETQAAQRETMRQYKRSKPE